MESSSSFVYCKWCLRRLKSDIPILIFFRKKRRCRFVVALCFSCFFTIAHSTTATIIPQGHFGSKSRGSGGCRSLAQCEKKEENFFFFLKYSDNEKYWFQNWQNNMICVLWTRNYYLAIGLNNFQSNIPHCKSNASCVRLRLF